MRWVPGPVPQTLQGSGSVVGVGHDYRRMRRWLHSVWQPLAVVADTWVAFP